MTKAPRMVEDSVRTPAQWQRSRRKTLIIGFVGVAVVGLRMARQVSAAVIDISAWLACRSVVRNAFVEVYEAKFRPTD